MNNLESRLNLFGLVTNRTQRISLVARAGRELVTFSSQSSTFSLYITHVDIIQCENNKAAVIYG